MLNVFERICMHKYRLFRGHLIYLSIRILHKAKAYTKIFAFFPFQIKTTSRVINLTTMLVYILQTRKIFVMALAKII